MDYFDILHTELGRAYAVAQEARSKGFDPQMEVEIPIAKDVAARVEGLVGPRGIASVIRELEGSGMGRTDIAFSIAEKIAGGEIIQGDKRTLIDQAIRTSVGILTEGVLVAPTEGIADVQINENPDGTNYVSVFFSGPIRSAGGTVAALAVTLADYARRKAGIGDYRPTETEISRYVEEVNVYEYRCNHLQYKPPDEHVAHIVRNCPVCVDGDPTEDIEVSVHRDLARVKSNRVRGGVPLVICEGIAAKAPKVLKIAKKAGLDWDWLQDVIKVKKREDKVEVKPDFTYLEGLVAGRPVFAYPMNKGGFRLRYGRSRSNGIMARNIHPATMVLLDSFIANGTHMKVERPGKGCILSVCDSIEPPVVKLKDGSIVRARTIEQAERLIPNVEKILFLGDILVTFGDFLKSNHPLMPSGYCVEWWAQEAKEGGLAEPPLLPSAKESFELSLKHSIPLHPEYTYPWHDISNTQLRSLCALLSKSEIKVEEGEISGLVVPNSEGKDVLEELLVERTALPDGKFLLSGNDGFTLLSSLGMLKGKEIGAIPPIRDELSPLENVCELSGLTIRKKAPTYIGGRMGRPEKSKERMMDGRPHLLFPVGNSKDRSVLKKYKSLKGRGKEASIHVEIARYRCTSCKATTFYPRCHICMGEAKPERVCQKCNAVTLEKEHCERPTLLYDKRPVALVELFESVRDSLGFSPSEINGVKGLSNENKISERLEKGFLRGKHQVYVFRDGTCRFDATDATLTHFRISEIGQTVEGVKALGYTQDHLGKPIISPNQVLALNAQDIVVSSHCIDYMVRVSAFIDDLLVHVYGMQPFYNIKARDELLGHLIVGLSPHTSGGVLGRIIGYTNANVGYAHPYFHTAKRRNCDGDEDSVLLLLDCLINFSRAYLTTKRGGTMDAPLTLTPQINPKEVDDEVHSMEVVSSYPLEFYRACERYSYPGEVKLPTVKDLLGKPEQYGDLLFTHDTASLNVGPMRTRYVTLGSIPDKIEAEFALHGKLKAVDIQDTAERLILSHFIPDLYGNLRSFSRQSFRCVDCNFSYRRPPLAGKCTKCGGKLLLTINKGGIIKYLPIAKRMVQEYGLPHYLGQRLELFEKEVDSIFEDDKIRQKGLTDFM